MMTSELPVERYRKARFRLAAVIVPLVLLGLMLALPQVAQAAPPYILNLMPNQGPEGSTVIINGASFGIPDANCKVEFNGREAPLLTWTDQRLTVIVPEGATTGTVYVTTSGGQSNGRTFTVTTAPPVGAPHIDGIAPNSGQVNSVVAINGTNFGTQDTGVVTFNGTPATSILAWTTTNILVQVPGGATSGPLVVTTQLGSSNGVYFSVQGSNPGQNWYIAEGSTAWGFEEYILMENTTGVDSTVNVTYNTTQYGRIPRPQAINVPPYSRVTLYVNDDIPNVDVSTQLVASQPIVCERAMYWNNRIEGHESIGVTSSSKTWYLSEGYTDNGFETWVLIQNPGTADAQVDVTYMTSKGVIQKAPLTVPGGQRYSINVGNDVGGCEVSTQVLSSQNVICERAMYWNNRRGGHDSIGVTKGSMEWYLAEGSSAWGFTTWLLLQNPTDEAAAVDVTFMTSGGPVGMPVFDMPPNSRHTVRVNDYVDNMDTSIAVKSDHAVIAERAMYWDNGTGTAGHETVGVTAPANSVFLAEGSTAWGFTTYVCIQNPNNRQVEVNVLYMTNEGATNGPVLTIPANSRVTVNVNGDLPNKDVSTRLECDSPIMAERAMYWNSKGGGHCSIGKME